MIMLKTEEIGPEAGRSSATHHAADRYGIFEWPEANNGAARFCRVLQYYADGMHYAHELNMDLVGYADSPDEALDCLRTIVTEQIAYAKAEGDEGLLDFPASPEFQRRAERAQRGPVGSSHASTRTHLRGEATGGGSVRPDV